MHEMSIALAVVDRVEEHARDHGRAEAVVLRIGELAGVVPESLHFCFALACEDTPLAGAELRTETVAGRARCAPCDRTWATGMPPDLTCPGCAGPAAALLSGRELEIAEVRWVPRHAPTPQES
ncbi:hydrogenase maturation nickel metallochaperone HypA [Streptomyces sp. NPDC050560]|uniref:hydrogenase maturation nickel metallochaperone HypA n=1 Tax=Streptomyces sp. NPDC050560 TaxID=3365630 RepID=UPI00378EF83F